MFDPICTCEVRCKSLLIHMHVDYYRESDDPNELSLFETLRETIYSEVATLISQNENRPHYLIELFKELQLLTTDYLRQRVLYDIKDVVSKYLVDENTDSVSAVSSFLCCGLRLLKSYVSVLVACSLYWTCLHLMCWICRLGSGLSISEIWGRNSAPFPKPKSMVFSQF